MLLNTGGAEQEKTGLAGGTMNQSEFTFELPELSGEVAAELQNVLYTFIDVFDAHYCYKIERYHRQLFRDSERAEPLEDQDPF